MGDRFEKCLEDRTWGLAGPVMGKPSDVDVDDDDTDSNNNHDEEPSLLLPLYEIASNNKTVIPKRSPRETRLGYNKIKSPQVLASFGI